MDIKIILPKKLYVLREIPNQDINNRPDEFNLYFKNFITPLYPWLDVKVSCQYGRNFGNCWKLRQFPDVDNFPLTISVYDEYGKKVAEASTEIELINRVEGEDYTVLFFGDSMTHKSAYVEHIVRKLYNIKTIGTRTFNGHTFFEGRGGWKYDNYFVNYHMRGIYPEIPTPVSPFLFPKGIDAKDYYGDPEYFETIASPDRSTYAYDGFTPEIMAEGQYYVKDGKLWQGDKEVPGEHEWEFSVKKYLERYDLPTPDAVSVLLGANDLQMIPYEEVDEYVEKYINDTKKLIAAVKEVGDIDVIVNMPITGADQYAWGLCQGTNGSEKQYNFAIRKAGEAIIEAFEGMDGVYISPMLLTLDTDTAFELTSNRMNLYNDNPRTVQCNWVHPEERGYAQMGDALAGVIEMVRQKRTK